MEPKEDPSILEVRDSGKGYFVDLETVIGIMISTVPPKYHTLIALERRWKGSKLTMSDMRITLSEFWKEIIKGRSLLTRSEVSLLAFTGKCYHCGIGGPPGQCLYSGSGGWYICQSRTVQEYVLFVWLGWAQSSELLGAGRQQRLKTPRFFQ